MKACAEKPSTFEFPAKAPGVVGSNPVVAQILFWIFWIFFLFLPFTFKMKGTELKDAAKKT